MKVEQRKSEIHGTGLFASSHASSGESIAIMVPVWARSTAECLVMSQTANARAMNHSKNPTMSLAVVTHHGALLIAATTRAPVTSGQELTVDYNELTLCVERIYQERDRAKLLVETSPGVESDWEHHLIPVNHWE